MRAGVLSPSLSCGALRLGEIRCDAAFRCSARGLAGGGSVHGTLKALQRSEVMSKRRGRTN